MQGNAAVGLSWLSIVRLGLVQAALGAIVVLTTSTLNRVMVVELALAAVIPGALVGLHYAIQLSRPVWGHRSDRGGNRTRWIVGGIALLAVAGTGAAASTLLFEVSFAAGLTAAIFFFALIGLGIGAAGTSLLALLASRTAPARRPAAATIVWMMMIAGIVVTAIVSGTFLDPYSHIRLVTVTAIAGALSVCVAALGVWGIERRAALPQDLANVGQQKASFREALADAWADRKARIFTIFVFASMLAYSMQDLILEPFGGLVYGMTPGETTKLSGVQHSGILLGMAMVGVLGSLMARRKPAILRIFVIAGCLGSAGALALLSLSHSFAPDWPLRANIFLLGFTNGAFAVAAIGMMMALAVAGRKSREGIRMGLWGAAQAIAFGLGGFLGTAALDVTRALTGEVGTSFAIVFAGEAALFFVSALIATRIGETREQDALPAAPPMQPPMQPAE